MDISTIEGEELGSVTFVQDYVQLDFNGPVLTLYIWPEVFIPVGVSMGEGSYAFGEPGYRDALCFVIGEPVETTSFEEGSALEIQFENGTIVRTSLRDEDYDGPEAGQFSTGEPGEPLVVF
ncbi:hypothetical protein SAMN05421819_4371 [Bryocella elongata]|uniref:Uncharacterized protein n=1 Tax=Bryocella elongata TaxID=863522 RepID=A0A1H6CBA9_9BACT|nr:hypothetical protein [Bryocella elongata]SEG69686.1 hypothetical protein SAMN05421819_4371 [Bryocella elongata]